MVKKKSNKHKYDKVQKNERYEREKVNLIYNSLS